MGHERFDEARIALRRAYGPDADFRDGQWDSIAAVLDPGSRLLVVQRTGWGKSVVYFAATRLMRDEGRGPTVVISPLLALMRNQVLAAERFGLRAATLDSTNADQWDAILFDLAEDRLDVLFVSPERLGNVQFRETGLPILKARAGLVVIDEAHCISDWGHDFRPDYQRIVGFVRELNARASVLATTATATTRVIEDVRHQLGENVLVQRGPLMRKSLRLSVFEMPDTAQRLAWLGKYLPRFPGSGIVYTLTVYDAEQVAEFLSRKGLVSAPYHADLPHERRLELEAQFHANELKVLVATTALGMGYDKADVGFVVHFQMPTSVIGYYQQVGRAGRMLDTAYACLLWGANDADTARHFFEVAMPPKAVFERLLAMLEEGPKEGADLIKAGAASTVWQALDLLEIEGVVERTWRSYRLAGQGKSFPFERIQQLREVRERDYQAMLDYAATPECRMRFLAQALDDPSTEPCGRCDRCKPHGSALVEQALIDEAVAFYRSATFPIEPKKRLVAFDGLARETKLDEEERLRPGVALSSYNDAGWGRLVREGKYGGGSFSAQLMEPALEAVRSLEGSFDAVVWVPSATNHKVEDFARKLAQYMNVPALDGVRKVRENRPQKAMRFSRAQLENVWEAFEIEGAVTGNVLLVDDIVDSGWTLTVIGLKLLHAGASSVTPFALATSRPRRTKL